jgi:hypothetical protein
VERHHKFANVITATVMRTILTKLPKKASRSDVSNEVNSAALDVDHALLVYLNKRTFSEPRLTCPIPDRHAAQQNASLFDDIVDPSNKCQWNVDAKSGRLEIDDQLRLGLLA